MRKTLTLYPSQQALIVLPWLGEPKYLYGEKLARPKGVPYCRLRVTRRGLSALPAEPTFCFSCKWFKMFTKERLAQGSLACVAGARNKWAQERTGSREGNTRGERERLPERPTKIFFFRPLSNYLAALRDLKRAPFTLACLPHARQIIHSACYAE